MYKTNLDKNPSPDVEQWLTGVMSKVYATMGMGLLVTFMVAMLMASSTTAMATIFGSALKWPVMLAPLAFVLIMSFGYEKFKASTLKLLFYGFSILQGLSLSVIFLAYTNTSIATTLGLAASMFLGMSAYGYFTKRSLHNLGGYLMVALIMLIVVMIVNIFLKSSLMAIIISCVGVLLFLALTAYDTQNIKETLWSERDVEKATIMGALTLYLDFLNLFLFLLRLIGVQVPGNKDD
jgi:FtsH-binding integral membrane protein